MAAGVARTLPQTCYPVVWLWSGCGLYAGPSLDLGRHSGSVWCLAVGVDGVLTVTVDSRPIVGSAVLIPPRTVHRLETHGGRLVSCYLDPSSGRAAACRARCREASDGIFVEHTEFRALAALPADSAAAQLWLDTAAPVSARPVDPRITRALARIRDAPAEAPALRDLASEAGLSESRFLHLFRDAAGTSLRRYRSWARLLRAGAAISAGRSLTSAAAEAGFASPSHLSDTFKSTFGLTASQLLAAGTTLVVAPD